MVNTVAERGRRMAELKPCPFCDGKASLKVISDEFHQVSCDNPLCKVLPQTWSYDTDEEAIEAWNRRAGEQDG